MNYDEGWVNANQELIRDTYSEAGANLDLNNVVWSARMTYDAARGLLPEISRWKHLNSLRAVLSLPPLPLPDLASTINKVSINGIDFVSNSQKWLYKGSTDFTLYGDFLKRRDITPVLKQRLLINNDIKPGANVLNIFSLIPGDNGWTSDTRLHPNMYPDYYDRILEYTKLAERWGFITEWCIFTREDLMPDLNDKRNHISRINQKLLEAGGKSFIRIVNEKHDDPTLYTVSGLLWCPGTRGGDATPYTGGNYGGFEPKRDCNDNGEGKVWVSANDQYYAIKGYEGENGAPNWVGTQHATPNIEPNGFDEIFIKNRRSNNPSLAAKIARDSRYGGGGTFHSTPGITSQLWGPIVVQCAEKFFQELSL